MEGVTPDKVIMLPSPEEQAVDTVLGFFTPEAIGAGLVASGFTVQGQVEKLAEIASGCDNPWATMAAMKLLREMMKDSLALSGRMKSITGRVEGEDSMGRFATVESKSLQLLTDAAASTAQALLPSLPLLKETIDVEYSELDGGDPAAPREGCPPPKTEEGPPPQESAAYCERYAGPDCDAGPGAVREARSAAVSGGAGADGARKADGHSPPAGQYEGPSGLAGRRSGDGAIGVG